VRYVDNDVMFGTSAAVVVVVIWRLQVLGVMGALGNGGARSRGLRSGGGRIEKRLV